MADPQQIPLAAILAMIAQAGQRKNALPAALPGVAPVLPVADVIDPNTNEFIVQDPTESEMLSGAQKFGPNLGARPDLDITPFLNRNRGAVGRYIEPNKNPGLNMLIDKIPPRPLRRGA